MVRQSWHRRLATVFATTIVTIICRKIIEGRRREKKSQ